MLVIHPDECIDCGVCVPECPAEAIFPDSDPAAEPLAERRRQGESPPDADTWNGVANRFASISAR